MVSWFEEAPMSVSLAAKTGLAIALVGGVLEFRSVPDPATQTEFLERLAVRIERANAVTPDTRANVTRVVERALAVQGRDAKLEARRQIAIVRLESALRAIPDRN
jgi:hypothetical protein